MDDRYYYLLLKYFNKLGSNVLLKLIKDLGSVKKLFSVNQDYFYEINGLRNKKIDQFVSYRKEYDLEKILEQLKTKNIKFIAYSEKAYPKLLKKIYDPPLVLFYKGEKPEKDLIPVGFVGTRKMSKYGKRVTKKLIEGLNNNFSIISGMALGIDRMSHLNSLKNNINTIAVLGSGIDVIYPWRNRDIYNRIIESGNGTVISEFLPGADPKPFRFPLRNRIISGLSKAVIVIEGPEKSGSLITARNALEQNREVFTVPHNIFSKNCKGPHKLIKQGARVVTKSKDIYEYLNIKKEKQKSFKTKYEYDLSENEETIINILDPFDALNVDDIYMKLSGKISVNKILSILFNLKIKEIIEELPGKRFVLYKDIEV